MSRSNDSFSKREREKKRAKKRQEKAEKKARRKEEAEGSESDDMMAYVDEYGQIVDTPPEQPKIETSAEDIVLDYRKEESDEDDSQLTGTVSFFNNEKGYGFIKAKGSRESYFVHSTGLLEPITEGNNVSFELEPGQKGMQAVKVKKVQ